MERCRSTTEGSRTTASSPLSGKPQSGVLTPPRLPRLPPGVTSSSSIDSVTRRARRAMTSSDGGGRGGKRRGGGGKCDDGGGWRRSVDEVLWVESCCRCQPSLPPLRCAEGGVHLQMGDVLKRLGRLLPPMSLHHIGKGGGSGSVPASRIVFFLLLLCPPPRRSKGYPDRRAVMQHCLGSPPGWGFTSSTVGSPSPTPPTPSTNTSHYFPPPLLQHPRGRRCSGGGMSPLLEG